MTHVAFSLDTTRFDEEYHPLDTTRMTTNFANLARGENRRQNLRRALTMINERFNQLASWDNPDKDRYVVELDIVSVNADIDGHSGHSSLPIIEMLHTTVVDRTDDQRIEGIVGNNFSSYIRDFDFSVVLPEYTKTQSGLPDDFGELHGNIFRGFLCSDAYTQRFTKPPVICLSVSSSKTYHRTDHEHPVLGSEYRQNEYSLTDEYFAKMGMKVRYFMPPHSAAPLSFYFCADLEKDYSDLQLAATISTMETFQKIYRPEIYRANSPAGQTYQPSLKHSDYSPTGIVYDRDERTRLGAEQGRFAEKNLITPHKNTLEHWSAQYTDRGRPRQEATS